MRAAPSAPASCGSSGTSSRIPKRFSRALRAAGFFATPPVMTAGAAHPTRSASAAIRSAMARCTPHAMSSGDAPEAMREITSDSANTVHIELTERDLREARERWPIRSRSISSVRAITSRNRPVPAAHLSFIAKSVTLPSGESRMTLLSCPPMSSTVAALGNRRRAPLAWQVISVTFRSAEGTASRP